MASPFHESLAVAPRLIRIGDTVTLALTSRMEYLPLTVEVTVRYLEQAFTVGEGIRIAWDTSGDVKQGAAAFTPEEPGSYVVRFGDFHRSFAVIDDTYTVCLVTVPFATGRYPRGNQLDHYHPDTHARHIPVNYVVMVTDERSLDPAWEVHKTLRAFHLIYGDAVLPFIDADGARMLNGLERVDDTSGHPADAALSRLRERWQTLGYPAPVIVGVDAPDADFVNSARRNGIQGLTGLNAGHLLIDPPGDPVETMPTDLTGLEQGMAIIPWRTPDGRLLSPRLYLADGRASSGGMSGFYADIEQAINPRNIFSVILDGDGFETVEMNRAAIAHLIGLPKHHNLVFCRVDDLLHSIKASGFAIPPTA